MIDYYQRFQKYHMRRPTTKVVEISRTLVFPNITGVVGDSGWETFYPQCANEKEKKNDKNS